MSNLSPPSFEPESSSVEFKTATRGRLPNDIWQTISAFSNSDGGTIVFGVTPDGEMVTLSRNEIDQIQTNVATLCNQSFSSVITPVVKTLSGTVRVYIPPAQSQLRPVYSKSRGLHKGSYIRVGSSNILIDSETLKRFSIASKGGSEALVYKGEQFNATLDLEAVRQYINLLNSKKENIYQNFSLEEILVKLRATDKTGDVTLFGLLAFGKDYTPQEIIAPSVKVSVTQYPGITKVNEDNFSETYMDNREFEGNVKVQFEKAFKFIKSKLPIKGTIDMSGIRRDYLIIPEVAIRESLANAITHRDYSYYSSSVQVDIYSNRLEIINPGASLVPVHLLDSAPSTSRNPLLMSYLKEHGITDQKARGIRTIKVSLREAGLLEPVFENIGQFFKVKLFASAFISAEDKHWLKQFSQFNFNQRQLNALAHVKNSHDGISNSEYRNINSMNNVRDDKKANKELRSIAEKNVLLIVGENKARRYIINPEYI